MLNKYEELLEEAAAQNMHVICNLGVVGSNPTRGSLKDEWNESFFTRWR